MTNVAGRAFGVFRTHQNSRAAVSSPLGEGRAGAAARDATENKNAPGAVTPDAPNRNAIPAKGASRGSAYTMAPAEQAQRRKPAAADRGAAAPEPAPAPRDGGVHPALADHRRGDGSCAPHQQKGGRGTASAAHLDAHLVGSLVAVYRQMGGAR